jgi:hypothetical protein
MQYSRLDLAHRRGRLRRKVPGSCFAFQHLPILSLVAPGLALLAKVLSNDNSYFLVARGIPPEGAGLSAVSAMSNGPAGHSGRR